MYYWKGKEELEKYPEKLAFKASCKATHYIDTCTNNDTCLNSIDNNAEYNFALDKAYDEAKMYSPCLNMGD